MSNQATGCFSLVFRFIDLESDRLWWLALSLSALLHLMFFLPWPAFFRLRLPTSPPAIEVTLVRPEKPAPAPSKPAVKKKPAAALKKKVLKKKEPKPETKPPAKKKIDRESPLARRQSIPRKQKEVVREKREQPKPDQRLTEIKERLNQEQEQRRLEEIRDRLRRENSPAARAQQAALTRSYLLQLESWLMRHWNLPEHLLNSGMEAVIILTISADGRLLAQHEEKLAADPLFNHAMRQAVLAAAPFPAFPPELKLDREEFVITFNPKLLRP